MKNTLITLTETDGPCLDVTGSSLDGHYVMRTLLPSACHRYRRTVGKPINVDELNDNISRLVQLCAFVAVASEEIKTMPNHVDPATLENAIRVSKCLYQDILPTAADELRKLTAVLHGVRATRAASGSENPEWNPERAYEQAAVAGRFETRV